MDRFDLWKIVGTPRPTEMKGIDKAFLAIENEINNLRDQLASK